MLRAEFDKQAPFSWKSEFTTVHPVCCCYPMTVKIDESIGAAQDGTFAITSKTDANCVGCPSKSFSGSGTMSATDLSSTYTDHRGIVTNSTLTSYDAEKKVATYQSTAPGHAGITQTIEFALGRRTVTIGNRKAMVFELVK